MQQKSLGFTIAGSICRREHVEVISPLDLGSSRLEWTGNDTIVDFDFDISLDVGIVLDETGIPEEEKHSHCNAQENGSDKAACSRQTLLCAAASRAIGSSRPVTVIGFVQR